MRQFDELASFQMLLGERARVRCFWVAEDSAPGFVTSDVAIRGDSRRFFDLHARDWIQEPRREDWRAFVVLVFVVLVVFVFAFATVRVSSLLFSGVATGASNFTSFYAAAESLVAFRVVVALVFVFLRFWLFLWFFELFILVIYTELLVDG